MFCLSVQARCCKLRCLLLTRLQPEWRYTDNASDETYPSGDGCEAMFKSSRSWEWVAPEESINADLSGSLDSPCGAGQAQATASSSAFFFGITLGAPTLSSLADKVGRKTLMTYGFLLMQSAGVWLAFVSEFKSFIGLRFVLGFLQGGVGMMCFVLPSEVVGKEHRGDVMMWTNLAWAVGGIASAVVAYFIRSWRTLMLSMVIPGWVFYLGPCQYLLESPAFLLGRGRVVEAREVLVQMAMKNGVEAAESVIPTLEPVDNDGMPAGRLGVVGEAETESFFDLVRQRPKRLCIMSLSWMSCSLAYFGISTGVGQLGSNIYVTGLLVALAEVPGVCLCRLMIEWPELGRRWTVFATFLATAVMCLLGGIVEGVGQTVLAVLGKMAVTGAFAALFLFGAELFPASVRATALGAQSTMARAGAFLAPTVLTLPSPMLVFGCFVGLVLPGIPFLSETLGWPVAISLKDQKDPDVRLFSELFGYSELATECPVSDAKTSLGSNDHILDPGANKLSEGQRRP
eukprot:TRINITY_DN8690_c0_g1_i8.p1 TRINITY_DN8690_c0_g1~~TRINITY_DN8690_c0_g1_i8.p1  ORF type:complete len:523 (-),score=49.61 TRINITY_DN8690_c0_g1_i8:33-1577(-)